MAEPQDAEATQATDLPKSRGSLMPKIAIAAFVGVVILVECAVAYFWIPSAEEVAMAAQVKITQEMAVHPPTTEQQAVAGEADQVTEVDLGIYTITAHNPSTGTNLRIDFHLFAVVREQEQEEFAQLFATHEHRFRDQIIVEVRNSEDTDLIDPGLGLIKRRILEKSNKLFGKPILRSVVFSEFSFVEQ